MKVKAITEIELDPLEMKEYMYEAARELDETFYEKLIQAPAYGDKFDEWESEMNNYLTIFESQDDYNFADFILCTAWYDGTAKESICKKWLDLCGNNKIKPLLEECIKNHISLTWQ